MLLGGVLSDRIPPRDLALASNVIRAMLTTIVAALVLGAQVQLWQLAVVGLRVRDGRRGLPAGDQHARPTARPGRPPRARQRGHAGHGPAGRARSGPASPASRSRSSASVPRSPSMPCPSPSPRSRCGSSDRAPDPVIRPIRTSPTPAATIVDPAATPTRRRALVRRWPAPSSPVRARCSAIRSCARSSSSRRRPTWPSPGRP